jgi:DNA-binding transcriptional MocR family regulator
MLRDVYRERRDAMTDALISNMPSHAKWQEPQSGVFFWIELPETVDSVELLTHCLEKQRVGFFPGTACSRGRHKNAIRLNFSKCDTDEIREGVYRISKALNHFL